VRVLLIGGSGFIGSYVAAQCVARGDEVFVYHRGQRPVAAGAREIIGDRNQLSASAQQLRASAPDVVVDLILSSGRQARELMSMCRGATARVVALSSCDVYRACGVLHGSEPGPLEPLPLTEDSALRTVLQTYPPDRVRLLQQAFGWLDEEYDKIPVEREILGDSALPGTVLRLPMVYGPGDPLHRFFPIIKRMDDRRPAILIERRQADWRGPYGYVENVAAAIVLAAASHRASGRIYNIAEVESMAGIEWATTIASTIGWRGELMHLPADRIPPHLHMPGNLDQHWIVDSSRIRAELGYAEPVPRDRALACTIDWERTHPPAFDPRAFDYRAEDLARGAIH